MRGRWLPQRWSAWIDRLTQSWWAHIVFWIGIIFKAIDGLLETAGGFLLLTISSEALRRFAYVLLEPELAEDPNDWLANHLLTWIFHLSTDTKTFAVAYLLVHGIIKLVIVGAIWFSQLWAYWLAGIVFSLFVLYQIAYFFLTYSPMMVFLTIVDLIIIVLLPPEHRRLKLEILHRNKRQR
ncbi:MAG: DUF2127 domain-containing protein [Planctomycetes bacterium]|nr:DUF2127 domain-containing protein [Planctomycetota bacterium]